MVVVTTAGSVRSPFAFATAGCYRYPLIQPWARPPNNALQRTRRQSLRSFLLAAELDIVIRPKNVKQALALILVFFCAGCAENAALEGARTACAGVSRSLPEGATPPVEVVRVPPRPGPHAPYPSAKACLEVQVETNGSVTFLRTVSTTNAAFADLFRQAVIQWRYQPATLHGEPIPVVLTVSAGFEHH